MLEASDQVIYPDTVSSLCCLSLPKRTRNDGSLMWSSGRAPLQAPSPLRTVRDTFASHGSSTQKRPPEKRGRGLVQM
jgi:hypothetical protein